MYITFSFNCYRLRSYSIINDIVKIENVIIMCVIASIITFIVITIFAIIIN